MGAAAVVYQGSEETAVMSHALGPPTHYTTFDTKVVGLLLMSNEILTKSLQGEVEVYMDNLSVIQQVELDRKGTGQYILVQIEDTLTCAKESVSAADLCLHVNLHWISAHDGVRGNECADALAKEAAQGTIHPAVHPPTHCSSIPCPPARRQYAKLPVCRFCYVGRPCGTCLFAGPNWTGSTQHSRSGSIWAWSVTRRKIGQVSSHSFALAISP